MTAATLPAPTLAVDTHLFDDIQRFGAADVKACFSCGVCTATCPLVGEDSGFPRRMIRYAEVGLRDKLLSSPELWQCYACGQCSETCPTQAEPSGFMASARRYAIASYDRTGLARLMYTMPLLGTLIAVALAAFFALFMYSARGPMSGSTLDIFGFIPEELIHNIGIVVMIVIFAAGLLGLATMARRVARNNGVTLRSVFGGRAALARTAGAAWDALAVDTLAQRRYRADCESPEIPVRWYRARWFLHAAAMWGFLGLLAATVLDYGLAIVGIKATGTPVPIWYPVRLLGTVAGIALVYGTTMLIWRRYRRADRSLRTSTAADWTFLILLELAGLTGFGLELGLYLPEPPAWGYWMFLFHVALAMELVLLAPFMKFAHAIYRPLALFFLSLSARSISAKEA
ncbi:MAG TPA: 4Fe-4S dicluster domain-containing protein [Anaerolineae bacterium]|nr:4Fe-4S dicluster domain-containing protein [Anaerolineae bacterium]